MNTPVSATQTASSSLRFTRRQYWAYGLFWSWNLIFLAFMLFGFAPQLLPDLVASVRTGTIPPVYLIDGIVLAVIPLAAIILGATILRRSPDRLFALAYGVEWPLMFVLAARFFLIRQANPAVSLLVVVAALGIAAFLWNLLDQGKTRSGWLEAARLVGLTLFLVVTFYAAAWVLFYAVPLLAAFVKWLADILGDLPGLVRDIRRIIADLWREPAMLPFSVLGFILVIYTATLFVLMPVAVPLMAIRAWLSRLRAQAARSSLLRPLALSTGTLALLVVLFALALRQPQQKAFTLMEKTPTSIAEAEALLKQEKTIRTGLTNAYLAQFRYLSSLGEVDHISAIYRDVFEMKEVGARKVQNLYEAVLSPLLYSPVQPVKLEGQPASPAVSRESQEAAELYERFFDQTIIVGEREAVVQAVRSTWSSQQAAGAWQAVDDREIHLNRQEISVQEHGDWAEVELYEEYQNQTNERQEVVYYFSLPESAVINGVWLGNSPDRQDRFTYRVSPRGAAQAVYKNEVRQQMDPALVEQIGPRQYRMRVFPVPPLIWDRDPDSDRPIVKDAPPLYMWLTYRVLAQDGVWPLPQLSEKRNVYWDGQSVLLVNGQPRQMTEDGWLPGSVPVSNPVQAQPHRVDFPTGQTVLALPTGEQQALEAAEFTGLRLAVVLDRSYSMTEVASEVQASFDRLAELADAGAAIDVYLTASAYRGETPERRPLNEVKLDEMVYFGGQNAAELLAQYAALKGADSYDGILVLTDGTGYELGEGETNLTAPDSPVWMVHLGGQLPLGYDDPTLEAIQASGGGVTGNLDESLARLEAGLAAAARMGEEETSTTDLVDGYRWSLLPAQAADTLVADEGIQPVVDNGEGFASLAARRLILAEMRRHRGSLDGLDILDSLHALAVENSIVTPYSSMIVLVNEGQQKRLDWLEGQGDRFAREYDEVGETPLGSPFAVTGVPEPEEWLLLALAAGMLGYYAYRHRRQRRITLEAR